MCSKPLFLAAEGIAANMKSVGKWAVKKSVQVIRGHGEQFRWLPLREDRAPCAPPSRGTPARFPVAPRRAPRTPTALAHGALRHEGLTGGAAKSPRHVHARAPRQASARRPPSSWASRFASVKWHDAQGNPQNKIQYALVAELRSAREVQPTQRAPCCVYLSSTRKPCAPVAHHRADMFGPDLQ